MYRFPFLLFFILFWKLVYYVLMEVCQEEDNSYTMKVLTNMESTFAITVTFGERCKGCWPTLDNICLKLKNMKVHLHHVLSCGYVCML